MAKTKKLPKFLAKLAEDTGLDEGREFLVMAPHYWGKGDTLLDAVQAMQGAGGPTALTKTALVVLDVPTGAYVDQMGNVTWTQGLEEPREIFKRA